ncbi:MAG: flagellar biosynthetic protein FliR [bacterium]|nr:flagellar biosynthetic protein FliR [bacterium]
MQPSDLVINFTIVWSWFLLFTRLSTMLIVLPGIGTTQVPGIYRVIGSASIAICAVAGGFRAASPESYLQGGMMVALEATLGFCLGIIPALMMTGVAVAGQVTTASIGLGAANLIDPSLGESVGILARLQTMLATIIFLVIDGHHIIIRAALSTLQDAGSPMFSASSTLAHTMLERFSATFELAVTIAAPILVTVLVTNFILGLVTKFIPQFNIFIISLPLTIGIGLFIVAYTFTGFARHTVSALLPLEETCLEIITVFGQFLKLI